MPELLQARQRRLAAELFDDIIVPPGDDHVLADRPATLGDNAAHLDGPLEEHAHGALDGRPIPQDQPALSRPAAATGHAADDAQLRVFFVDLLQEGIDWKCERVAKKQDGRVAWIGAHQRIGPAEHAYAVRRLLEHQVERLQLHGLLPAAQPQAHGRRPLDFLVIADNGFARAPHERAGGQTLLEGVGNRFRCLGVMRREEYDGQIGRALQFTQGKVANFIKGPAAVTSRGESGGKRHDRVLGHS